jgi:hypothetical protein
MTPQEREALRDQFAGRAMQAQMIAIAIDQIAESEFLERSAEDPALTEEAFVAQKAYRIADAMLAQRDRLVKA